MNRENEVKGIIYSARNKVTGEYYVGATTRTIKERRSDHEEKANNGCGGYFQSSIAGYGTDAFDWNQEDTASSLNELAQKEKQYILEYNSKEEGYNADSGGGFRKNVYQYSLDDGSLINKFDCLDSACSKVSAIKQQISRACLSVNKMYGGFYWSYEYIEPFKPEDDKRLKTVEQYNSNGKWVKTYSSVVEASWDTSISKSSIAKASRGERKTAGGYIWQYV